MGFLKDGKSVEKQVSRLFENVKWSTEEEDINEHWDFSSNGLKYDVKGLKKSSRSDSSFDENHHVVEFRNVNGKLGWLYGEADYFIFETYEYYIVVQKEKLREFVESRVTKEYVDRPDKALLAFYRRNGRKDTITYVKTIDLMVLSSEILHKKENIIKNPLFESIHPHIREKERLNAILANKN